MAPKASKELEQSTLEVSTNEQEEQEQEEEQVPEPEWPNIEVDDIHISRINHELFMCIVLMREGVDEILSDHLVNRIETEDDGLVVNYGGMLSYRGWMVGEKYNMSLVFGMRGSEEVKDFTVTDRYDDNEYSTILYVLQAKRNQILETMNEIIYRGLWQL